MTIDPSAPATVGSEVPARMLAAVAERPGDADVIRLTEVAVPRPVGAEVLVRVIGAGLNPLDVRTRAGEGEAAGVASWPAVLGHDFSGVVVAAPYALFGLQPGDEVYGVAAGPRGPGSFAEYVAVPAGNLAPKPATLTHLEAAAAPLAALTAWGVVVELIRAHEGQRILVHAGAGGVGHLAVQLGTHFGAHVVTTASEQNLSWLRELGAAEVIDRNAPFEQAVHGVDAVLDLVGDDAAHTGPRSLGVLRPGGLLVTLPGAGWPGLAEQARRAGVRATTYRTAPEGATLGVLGRLIDSGDLRVVVADVFPFDRMADAQRRVEAGHMRGKVVVRITEG